MDESIVIDNDIIATKNEKEKKKNSENGNSNGNNSKKDIKSDFAISSLADVVDTPENRIKHDKEKKEK